MGVLKLRIYTGRDQNTLTGTFEQAGGNRAIATRVVNFITSVLSGTELAMSSTVPPSVNIRVQESEVQATGSFTFSGVASANDTVLINGVTFTFVASGATGNQVNVGLTADASATNLATTINASASSLISGYVTAARSSSGVCKITSSFYGTAGNQVTIAKGVDGGGVMTVSPGARMNGGSEDPNAQTLNF